jgi:hypothetical protein
VVHDPALLSRYTFGLGTAEFLVCRNCGVYVGAVTVDAGSAYAIVNVNAFADARDLCPAGSSGEL